MKLITKASAFSALLGLASFARACVEFTATYSEHRLIFSASLTDNYIEVCQISDHLVGYHWDQRKRLLGHNPIVLDCHEGHWAALAFIDNYHAVVRYRHGDGFDETFSVEADMMKTHAFGTGNPSFDTTQWGCRENWATYCWRELDGVGKELQKIMLNKEGWNL